MHIENGTYPAHWTAYVIEVVVNGEMIKLKTVEGIRGINFPVTASYLDGVWSATDRGHPIKLKS